VHVSARADLTFFKDKVVTGADDTIMKIFSLAEGSIVENGEPLDLESEIFAISSDQVETIAVGGEDKKAYLHRV